MALAMVKLCLVDVVDIAWLVCYNGAILITTPVHVLGAENHCKKFKYMNLDIGRKSISVRMMKEIEREKVDKEVE